MDFVNGHFAAVPPLDLFPSSNSALIAAGDPAYLTPIDFNNTSREQPPDAGAYRFDAAGNPGWAISEGLKPISGSANGTPKPPVIIE